MRMSDWSSDVCSSDLDARGHVLAAVVACPLDHRDRAGVPDGEPVAGLAGGEELSARGAVEHRVPDNEVLMGHVGVCRAPERDRTSVVECKGVSVRVDLGGRRILKTKQKTQKTI